MHQGIDHRDQYQRDQGRGGQATEHCHGQCHDGDGCQDGAEDTELITRVQKGMESASYVPGPLGTSEVCLRSFAKKLRSMVPEARLAEPPPAGWSRPSTA